MVSGERAAVSVASCFLPAMMRARRAMVSYLGAMGKKRARTTGTGAVCLRYTLAIYLVTASVHPAVALGESANACRRHYFCF